MRRGSLIVVTPFVMALLGCGEDGDDSDDAVQQRAQLAIEQSCQHLQDCGSKNYGSAQHCALRVSEAYEEKYKKRDVACREAWISERECYLTQSCEQLGKGCEDEGSRRWNVCKDWEN